MDHLNGYRGPPPCQNPDCTDEAHFRNGYTRCLEHDSEPFVAAPLTEPKTAGISNGELTFFFGASCGSSRKTLRQMEEPNVCLSYATKNNSAWNGIESLMIDSGGYSLITSGGGSYDSPITEYLDYVDDVGAKWFMTRDIPAADPVLKHIDNGVSEAISRTVKLTRDTLDAARDHPVDAEPIAVLQGQTPADYVKCYHELVRHDALTGRVAIGSLKGHTSAEVASIVRAVRDVIREDERNLGALHGHTEGGTIELHGLGVDVPELEYEVVRNTLSSADSSRYIATARWRGNRDETPARLRDDEPKQGWFETARAYLDMRTQLRDVLDHEAAEGEVTEVSLADSQQTTLQQT